MATQCHGDFCIDMGWKMWTVMGGFVQEHKSPWAEPEVVGGWVSQPWRGHSQDATSCPQAWRRSGGKLSCAAEASWPQPQAAPVPLTTQLFCQGHSVGTVLAELSAGSVCSPGPAVWHSFVLCEHVLLNFHFLKIYFAYFSMFS